MKKGFCKGFCEAPVISLMQKVKKKMMKKGVNLILKDSFYRRRKILNMLKFASLKMKGCAIKDQCYISIFLYFKFIFFNFDIHQSQRINYYYIYESYDGARCKYMIKK